MKRVFGALPALFFAAWCSAQSDAGIPVKLVLLRTVASGSTASGTRVPLAVEEDVKDAAGNVLLAKGTPVLATVIASRKAGTLSAPVENRPARLSIALSEAYVGGKTLPISFGTGDGSLELKRDTTIHESVDQRLRDAWKDPTQRALLKKLAGAYENEQPISLTSQEQSLLTAQGPAWGLSSTTAVLKSSGWPQMFSAISGIASSQSIQAFLAATPAALPALAAAEEMAGLCRRTGAYLHGRFRGRNIVAPPGMELTAYVHPK